MPFLLLIFLLIACVPIDWPEPPFDLGIYGSIACTLLTMATLVLAAGIISYQATEQLENHPDTRSAIAHRYSSARIAFFFVQMLGFAFCLVGLGWGWTVQTIGTIRSGTGSLYLPGMELVLLLPFLICLIASWFIFYDADRAFHAAGAPYPSTRFWSRGGYVLFLMRQNLVIVFLPILLTVLQQGIWRAFPEWAGSTIARLSAFLMVPFYLIVFPLFLPAILGLKPLPPGVLRSRLEQHARRLGFRYSEILHWDTRGGVANAMVVGILPWIRYVVFTDRLLNELSDEEVDGVLGHEVGHVRHGHILYYAVFLILSFMVLGAAYEAIRLTDWLPMGAYRTFYLVGPVIGMALYMFLAFGFLSRRCERQADLFGCRAVSCADPHCTGHDGDTRLVAGGNAICPTGIGIFIRSLLRVEDINGMARARTKHSRGLLGVLQWLARQFISWLQTWQHSTIERRVAFLCSVQHDLTQAERFQRHAVWLQWGLILSLLGVLGGLILWQGWGVLAGAI